MKTTDKMISWMQVQDALSSKDLLKIGWSLAQAAAADPDIAQKIMAHVSQGRWLSAWSLSETQRERLAGLVRVELDESLAALG
jgi:hypothetical protein